MHCKDVRREVLARCLNRDTSFLDAVLDGVFTVPGDGWSTIARVLAPIAHRATAAGWWSKPSRILRSRRRCKYAQLGFQNLSALL